MMREAYQLRERNLAIGSYYHSNCYWHESCPVIHHQSWYCRYCRPNTKQV